MRSSAATFAGILYLLASPSAQAQNNDALTADKIAQKAVEDGLFSRTDATATVQLVIFEGGKENRRRTVDTLIKRIDGKLSSLLTFVTPPDMAGTKLLSIEESEDDRLQFLYLPAFRRSKQISGTDKSKSFMKTDFTYADVEGIRASEWTWTKRADEKYNNDDCFVIEGLPKPNKAQDYTKIVMWVHKKHLVTMKQEFFTKGGAQPIKTYAAERLSDRDGRWVPMRATMVTPGEKTSTLIEIMKLDLKSEINPNAFRRASLDK